MFLLADADRGGVRSDRGPDGVGRLPHVTSDSAVSATASPSPPSGAIRARPALRAPPLLGIAATTGGMAVLFAAIVRRLALAQRRWTRELVRNLYKMAVKSVPLVVVTALFTGAIMVIQAATIVKRYGAQALLGWGAGFGTLREVAPLLTALMISGRVGANNTAELGTMVVTEQIDALRALAIDPIAFLIVPRFVAIIVDALHDDPLRRHARALRRRLHRAGPPRRGAGQLLQRRHRRSPRLRRRRQRARQERRLRVRHRPRRAATSASRPRRRPRGRARGERHGRRERGGRLRPRLRRELPPRRERRERSARRDDRSAAQALCSSSARPGSTSPTARASSIRSSSGRSITAFRGRREPRGDGPADVRDRQQVALLPIDHDGLHRDDPRPTRRGSRRSASSPTSPCSARRTSSSSCATSPPRSARSCSPPASAPGSPRRSARWS